jgi:hypothetical protein
VAYTKKLHRFADCGSNMGAGDRSEGSITDNVKLVTCGACKARILNVIAQADWAKLTSTLQAELHHIAVNLDKEVG